MIRFTFIGLVTLSSFYSKAAIPQDFFSRVDAFLKKHVSNGLVDYKAIKKDPKELQAIYDAIGNTDLTGENDSRKKAFYINAYNVAVIYSIVKKYPIKSPLDRAGFFDSEKHKIAREDITLDILEKKKLIGTYNDPRFHFALVCAAKSCPPLQSYAYTPAKLDTQLNEVTTAALEDKSFIRVYSDQKKVEISKIFEWYKDDFAANGMLIIEWINQYRREKIPTTYPVGYYEYNWMLNGK